MTQAPFEPYPKSGFRDYPDHDARRQLPPPSQQLATWSLILAVIPVPLVLIGAVTCACIVISRSKDGRQHGKRKAVAALVIVGLWVVAGSAALAMLVAGAADRDASGRVTDGGRVSVTDLRAGDCLGETQSEVMRYSVPVVPCGDPHDSEVLSKFDLTGEWSDAEQVMRTSEAGCIDRFADYVGVEFRKSSLEVTFFHPTDRAGFAADPSVVCLLVSPDPVTDTLKLSKR